MITVEDGVYMYHTPAIQNVSLVTLAEHHPGDTCPCDFITRLKWLKRTSSPVRQFLLISLSSFN